MNRIWNGKATNTANRTSQWLFLLTLLTSPLTVTAIEPVHCDSGNPANWLSNLQMHERLSADGWNIDSLVKKNGCWKVTGKSPKGNRAYAYFHPLSGKKL